MLNRINKNWCFKIWPIEHLSQSKVIIHNDYHLLNMYIHNFITLRDIIIPIGRLENRVPKKLTNLLKIAEQKLVYLAVEFKSV